MFKDKRKGITQAVCPELDMPYIDSGVSTRVNVRVADLNLEHRAAGTNRYILRQRTFLCNASRSAKIPFSEGSVRRCV